jgi:signal-transduction protein with cAMP-binding, CBS, and nucleotidyltransferase domain
VFAGSISAVLVQNNKHEGISIDGIVEDISEQQRSDKEKDNLIADLQTSVIMLSQRISPYIKHVPSCGYTSTIVEAANTMTAEKSASILVRGDNNEPIGIVTDHDIRERIVASGKEMNTPVYSIMTAPVSSISSSASIYDVLVVIREQRHRYLLVNDSNDVVLGIIDADDIFEGSFTNYLFFLRRIDTAVTAGMLAEYHHHLLHMVNGLIRNNADLRSITKFTTLISDAITKRIIQLAIDQVGEPPRRFAFLCMGSEGREEQTLLTDQDNAIVYDDADDEHGASVQQYFLTLGERISDNLNRAGYSYCKGGMMAMNTKWCQPLSVWKKYFTQWVTTANAQDVLEFKIFFDCRFIEGSKDLSDQLNDHIHRLVSSYSNFFVYLSENLLRNELPDGIEKLKTPIDLKIALLPIVDFARLYGLKHRSRSHNTIDRLEFIREREIISDHMFNNILNAYTLLMHTRLLHQTHCHTSNIPIDNIVQPQHLSDMHLLIIKRYFSLLKEIKQKISIDFKGIL